MSTVLHAHWLVPEGRAAEARLLLWAEASARAEVPGGGIVPAHPFAADTGSVLHRLETLLPGGPPSGSEDRRILLRLPTCGDRPQASPRFFGEAEPAPGRPDRLALWSVDGPAFDAAAGLTLLLALPAGEALPRDLALADDLRFWQAAARFALELMCRQAILPGLRRDASTGELQALWLPELDDADQGRLTGLAGQMPAVCRADGAAERSPEAGSLLASFLETSIDRTCRRWLSEREPRARPAQAGLVEAWLSALARPTAQLEGPRANPYGAALEQAHRHWLEARRPPPGAGFRLALRLQAPSADTQREARWPLHLQLAAADDPSLRVAAAEAWQAGEAPLEVFGRRFERPGPGLADGLAWAERQVPALRRARRRRHPRKLSLSTREAQAFLLEAAPLLTAAGVVVERPTWWDDPASRLGLRLKLRAQPAHDEGLGLETLVDFDWQVMLGDRPLGEDELADLARAHSPLTRIAGRWLRLDPYQARAAQRILAAGAQQHRLVEALPLGLGAETEREGLPLGRVEVEGWLTTSLARLRGQQALPDIPAPPGLRAELRPYQQHGLTWLADRVASVGGALLADDMGLGKTLQTLALLMHLRREQGGVLQGPVLLLAPTSVVTSWVREARRWAPGLRVHLHQGAERLEGLALAEACAGAEMVATSYALLRRDRRELERIDWQGIVLDEAQQIKNPGSQQSRIVRGLSARWRLALTGTPVENQLTELWSILDFLLPGYLGARARFQRELARPIERHRDALALRRLRRLTGPFVLRRLKRDPAIAAELPPKQEVKVYCQPSPEQVLLYESVLREAMAELESASGIARRGRVLALLTRLKQVCNHPAQLLGPVDAGPVSEAEARRSGKLARLGAMVEELVAGGEAALVFSQYRVMGGMLRRYLQARIGREVLFLHGAQPAALRDRIVQRFQDDAEGPPVLVLSLKAGGTGLTLTRASHVLHFDRWWNPAVEDQATDRAYRIGQSRPVTVHKLLCLGTLEERIDAMLERKRELAERVVGSGEDWLTELAPDDLRRLVELRTEGREP